MSAALATQAGLPGRFREDSYDLPTGLPFERWCEVVGTLQQIERSVKWWVGDALVYGEAAYGEMASQAFPDAFSGLPYAESTLRAAMWVSERFPRGTRHPGLSWTHHRVVAELPPIEARALLEEAAGNEDEGKPRLSTRELIERRDRRKRTLAGGSVDTDGVAADDGLAWVPDIDDLTDQARAALEQHAPQGRLRTAYVSGWLRAMVWAEQRDAFLEGAWRL